MFGEMALENIRLREERAVAMTNCDILMISLDDLHHAVHSTVSSSLTTSSVGSVTVNEKLNIVSRVSAFCNTNILDRLAICKEAKLFSYQRGTVIVPRKSYSSHLYMIMQGDIDVTLKPISNIRGQVSSERVITTLSVFSSFGESGMLHEWAQTLPFEKQLDFRDCYDFRCKTAVELLAIPAAQYAIVPANVLELLRAQFIERQKLRKERKQMLKEENKIVQARLQEAKALFGKQMIQGTFPLSSMGNVPTKDEAVSLSSNIRGSAPAQASMYSPIVTKKTMFSIEEEPFIQPQFQNVNSSDASSLEGKLSLATSHSADANENDSNLDDNTTITDYSYNVPAYYESSATYTRVLSPALSRTESSALHTMSVASSPVTRRESGVTLPLVLDVNLYDPIVMEASCCNEIELRKVKRFMRASSCRKVAKSTVRSPLAYSPNNGFQRSKSSLFRQSAAPSNEEASAAGTNDFAPVEPAILWPEIKSFSSTVSSTARTPPVHTRRGRSERLGTPEQGVFQRRPYSTGNL